MDRFAELMSLIQARINDIQKMGVKVRAVVNITANGPKYLIVIDDDYYGEVESLEQTEAFLHGFREALGYIRRIQGC
jgi:hypothetical protein